MNDLYIFLIGSGDNVETFVRCFCVLIAVEFIGVLCGLIGRIGGR